MKITVVKPKDETEKKKRVAAYARVSTFKEEQEESFEAQFSYYSRLISNNANYEMVEVYADQGISGTKAESRPNFMRMINDALAGKIDIIYCKSISRFSRNCAECMEIVRKLKNHKVEVIFEREQLSSFNPMSEMVFNFLTIIAEEESKSISDNTTWALDRLAERGIRHLGNNRVFGYDEIDGVLTPNVYAPAVKMIFEEYVKGTKLKIIKKYLEQMGCVSMQSKKPLTSQAIIHILSNVIYKGDRLIQKKPHPNYLTKKPDYTREFAQYYITDAHEAIISKGLWDAVQEERKRRIKEHTYGKSDEKLPVRFRGTSHPLFGKVICSECDSPYERKTIVSGGKQIKIWRCKKKNGECHNHLVHEDVLIKQIGDVDYLEIEKVIVYKNRTIITELKKKYELLTPIKKSLQMPIITSDLIEENAVV